METPSTFVEVREQYADYFARAAAIYNVSPLLGRLYAYLLLSPEPMSLGELADAAGAAKSTVSVVMRTLEHYRVVRRQWVKGDRRDYFTAQTDTGVMLRELYDLFFSKELGYMKIANKTAKQALESAPPQADWPDGPQREQLLERLNRLDAFAVMITSLLEQIMGDDKAAAPAESIQIEVEE